MPSDFSLLAPAKINLALHVVGRRAPGAPKAGYHELDSLVAFAAVGDLLTFSPAMDLSLTISGPFGQGLAGDQSNLVLQAARWLKERAGVSAGAAIHLEKNLPLASGIGGGSSDAAATLKGLARLWSLDLPSLGLPQAALSLGADLPVCLLEQAARVSGIGELLAPTPALPALGILLVNPGLALPTPSVFAARKGPFGDPMAWPARWPGEEGAFLSWLKGQRNDLEAAAIELCPPIAQVLAALGALEGAQLARMSGSGATCFALFPSAAEAKAAQAKLSNRPGWWAAAGRLF